AQTVEKLHTTTLGTLLGLTLSSSAPRPARRTDGTQTDFNDQRPSIERAPPPTGLLHEGRRPKIRPRMVRICKCPELGPDFLFFCSPIAVANFSCFLLQGTWSKLMLRICLRKAGSGRGWDLR